MVVQAHISLVSSLSSQNYADGLRPILDKLQEHLINHWRKFGRQYKVAHNEEHPPFNHFLIFVTEVAGEFSDSEIEDSICGS